MRFFQRIIVLFVLALTLGIADAKAGFADDAATCFNARCQGNAQSCLRYAFDDRKACQKSARAACDKVMMAQKFECLTKALSSCSATHRTAEAACTEATLACSAACGPPNSGTVKKTGNYWCKAESDEGPISGFCAGTPNMRESDQWDLCFKQLLAKESAVFSLLDCHSL